jgi:DNA-binding CsgD family transcriptional regulator
MIEGLNKKTLERLYIKQGKSTYKIAKMYGCSIALVRYRCIKYGIKLRPRRESIKIKKSVLQKLYVKEGNSLEKIADMLSCSPLTVSNRCRQYGIKIGGTKRIKGLNKSLLQKLYIREGKTIREIGKILGCSRDVVRRRCKEFGVPLRPTGCKRVDIDESTLCRLYVKEGKTLNEIAEIFGCAISTVYKRVKRIGL